MPSRATELKYVRRIFADYSSEFISISGMEFYHDRFFYKYANDAIYFVEVGLSGAFRGEHWKSLLCSMHIYYMNFPGYSKPPVHESGKLIPTYRQSRLRFGLERTLDQSEIIERLSNSMLRYDRNFWHVLEDESNLKDVLRNMATVVRDQGLPLVQKAIYSRAVMLEREITRRRERR